MKVAKGLAMTAFRVAYDADFYAQVSISVCGMRSGTGMPNERYTPTGQTEFRRLEERGSEDLGVPVNHDFIPRLRGLDYLSNIYLYRPADLVGASFPAPQVNRIS